MEFMSNEKERYDAIYERQLELGKICLKYGFSKLDLYLLERIKNRKKVNEVNCVIDKNITLEDLERMAELKIWTI